MPTHRSPSSFENFAKGDFKNEFAKLKNTYRRGTSMVKRPVFVVGCPRSGTTVLGRCLAAHPEIAGDEESLFLMLQWTIFSEMYRGNPKGYCPLMGYVNEKEIVEAIGQFSDRIIGALLNKQGKHIFVDHTPWYVFIAPFLDLIYKDCVYIHIIRDGRMVVDSLSHSHKMGYKWAGDDIKERTHLWVNMVEHGLNIKKHIPSRYYEIRYEDFYCHPKETLIDAFNFLGLKFSNKTLEPLSVAHANPRTKEKIVRPDQLHKDKNIERHLDGSWSSNWSQYEKKDFIDIGGKLMDRLLYKY